nr:unnamed protein product [Callosobruchus analis]
MQWKVPESEMVAYRSFRPFFPLLRVEMDYRVQLWAVWAIHHVCTKIVRIYTILMYKLKNQNVAFSSDSREGAHALFFRSERQVIDMPAVVEIISQLEKVAITKELLQVNNTINVN